MKDWKDYHLFRLISLESCKVYGKAPTDLFYDRQTLSVFRDVIEAPKPLTKYYFADTTMKIVDDMLKVADVDHSDMYQGKKEVGACLSKEDLAFVYAINPNTVKIIVVSGTNPQKYVPATDVIGAVVMDLKTGKQKLITNSLAGRSKAYFAHAYTPSKPVLKAIKDFRRSTLHTDYVDMESLPPDQRFEIIEEQTRMQFLDRAFKMLIFLKYAKSNPRVKEEAHHKPRVETVKELKDRGIIVVDANWDSELYILNPFGVAGHFRNQPYKDEEGKWQKKLIIIEPFTKKGYHRKSTKELQQLKQKPKNK